MEELMQTGIVQKPTYGMKAPGVREASASEPMAAVTTARLTRRAALMLTLLLSFGLWTAIWALTSAIRALVSF
jgi:hypothetical protein